MKWLADMLLWPFKAVFRLVFFVIELVGRFLAALIGMLLIAVGVLVSMTIVGAIVGVPLVIVGITLLGTSIASHRHP